MSIIAMGRAEGRATDCKGGGKAKTRGAETRKHASMGLSEPIELEYT